MTTPKALRIAYIGFALIGLAVVTAYLFERRPATQADLARVQSTPAPAEGAIPDTRPQFTLSDLDGRRHPISEWDGHPQLVNFWATWCVPCRKEIPLLNRLQTEQSARNLKIIGIAVDFPEDVRKFVQATPLQYDVLVGEDDALEAAKAYGVETMALPFSAFVDSHGRIMTVHLGELHEAALRATLEALYRFDAGTLSRKDVAAALAAADSSATPASTSGSH
jgi:thiol-disulfide isomerase/thioredoxin